MQGKMICEKRTGNKRKMTEKACVLLKYTYRTPAAHANTTKQDWIVHLRPCSRPRDPSTSMPMLIMEASVVRSNLHMAETSD